MIAFSSGLEWDIRRVQGVSVFAGGLFNTVISGTGWLAITAHGTPVVLNTDAPTYAEPSRPLLGARRSRRRSTGP